MASQHEHARRTAHPHRAERWASDAGSRGYLSIVIRPRRSTLQRSAGVILSHQSAASALFTRATYILSRHFTSSPRHASLLLCIRCAFAGPGSLATLLSPRVYSPSHSTFPSSQSRHLEFATAIMPKKKGGKVQGRAKQKVKAQNASAGGKPAWMKKFAKSFDDGRSLLPFHHMPIPHTLPRSTFNTCEVPIAETFLPQAMMTTTALCSAVSHSAPASPLHATLV